VRQWVSWRRANEIWNDGGAADLNCFFTGDQMTDWVRIGLYVGTVAAIVLIVCLLIVGFANSGSRNISLAIGTVFGAFLLLGTQLGFELQSPPEKKAIFKTLYTTDKAHPRIEQFFYPLDSVQRAIDEHEANEVLLRTNKAAYEDGEKLWKDMSLLSVVLYLWTVQHDWQIARDVLKGIEKFQFLSKPDQNSECSKIAWVDVKTLLNDAGNVFANVTPFGMPFDYMCLPPSSSIKITGSTVVIETPFCSIDFEVDQQMVMSTYGKPYTTEMPMLPDNHPRYETRTGIIRATVKYSGLRSQSRTMPKYQTWANDVLDRASIWFDTEIIGANYLKSNFD
jgi:hypothetical protein